MVDFSYKKIFDVTELNQLDCAVANIAAHVRCDSSTVVYLYGELGSGKTTLAQCWLRHLAVDGAIPSPTYNIVNIYDGAGYRYIHADLYRIASPDELLYLDVREWREQATLILIEWPQRGRGLIPEPDMACSLSLVGDYRELMWQTMDCIRD